MHERMMDNGYNRMQSVFHTRLFLLRLLFSAIFLSCPFLPSSQIVDFLNFLYCLGMLLEFAAFVTLRFTDPDLPRPYR